MSDRFVETTSTSWSSRIAQSITGVMLGIIFIIGSIVLLFWNEGRYIQTARSLAEGGKVVIEAAPDAVDPSNEGMLVHVSGNGHAAVPLADQVFGVSTIGLHLVRIAEMYQWQEQTQQQTHKGSGGSEERVTIYTYNKVWSEHAINSQNFRDTDYKGKNPHKIYNHLDVPATDATLGAFHLDAPVLNLLPADMALQVDPKVVDAIKARIAQAQAVDGKIYIGGDPSNPQVGDYRISYVLAPVGPVSVIGRQTGTSLTQYRTKAGDRLLFAVAGLQSATDMFKEAERDNRILAWILRAAGIAAMWLGAYLVLRPLVVVADVVPLLGSLVGAGAGLVALVFTALVAAAAMAIAWLWYRPVVSGMVAAIGLAAAFALHRLAVRRRVAGGPPAAATP